VEGAEASKTLQPRSAMHWSEVFCSCPGNKWYIQQCLDPVSGSLRLQGALSNSTPNLGVPRHWSEGIWMCASIAGVGNVDFFTIGTLSGRVVCHQVLS
jgi:hypothetical protein